MYTEQDEYRPEVVAANHIRNFDTHASSNEASSSKAIARGFVSKMLL